MIMFKRFKWFKKEVKPSFSLDERAETTFRQKKSIGLESSKQNENFIMERTVYLYPVSLKEAGGSKWGYINAKGEFVLKPIYDHAGDFQDNGLAIVRLKGLTGVIDVSGYFIVSPKYETIHPFSEGRATVIDHLGFKVIDESGKELTSKAYSFIGDYKEGRALFSITNEKAKNLYGYLNKRGKEVLPPVYESATDFKDGKAIVKLKEGSYALINLTGKVLHTYSFVFVGDYGEGLLAFQKSAGDKFGYIDEQGKIKIEPSFTWAQPFQENGAIVTVSDGKHDYYGLIDKSGRYIFKPNYHQLLYLGEGRVAIGKAVDPEKPYIGSLYALGDTNGHILTGFIYNGIAKFEEGSSSVYNDHSTFFIDKKGNRILNLPIVKGSGELHYDKTLIKGEIDFRLFYFKRNGEPVWKQNTVISLKGPYEVVEEKYKPNKDFLVYYPQISGMVDRKTQAKINQSLKDLAGIKETLPYLQLESNYIGDFEIPFYKKDLLVIEITGYNYPFGAAHGMPIKKYVHIDLKSGEIFSLKDLFKPVSPYVKFLSEWIGNEIKNNPKYTYVFPGSYKGIQVDQPFFISEEGVNIYFVPYEIAPYAVGFPTFTIFFKNLTQIIDHTSRFWKSFH
jgi:hypothetical protein